MLESLTTLADSAKQVLGPNANEILQIAGAVLTIVITLATIAAVFFKGLHRGVRRVAQALFGRTSSGANSEQAINEVAAVQMHPIASLRELETVWRFDEGAYGSDENISFKLFEDWWTAYNAGFIAAYRNDVPIGIFGAFPVTEQWAEQLVRREVSEKDLTPDIIRKSRRHHWYISGISIAKRGKGLSRLPIKLICQSAQRWYEKNYDVFRSGPVHVFSVGTTLIGQQLLHELLHFDVVKPAAKHGEHPIFAREVSEAQIRLFLAESPLCKGCCDPHFLAQMGLRAVAAA